MSWFPLRAPAPAPGLDEDGRLLASLRAREASALEHLVERYGRALARAAWVWLGDAAGADEAAHEALIAAWDGAARTDERTALRPWLFAILCNHCRNQRRAAARRRAREEAAGADWAARRGGGAPDPRLAAMREALAELDDDHREVVILRYLEELPVADTARALGIPEGTVKSRTHAALARLRERLERTP